MKDNLHRDYEYLLWLLSRREYPEKKLREKLKARKLAATDIDSLIDRVRDAGYFSEERFRKSRARQLTRRGDSPRSIKAKVKSETGLEMPSHELDQVYEDLGTTNEEVLQTYLAREFHKLERSGRFEDSKLRHQKLIERALRKGFSYDLAKKALQAVINQASESDEK